MPLFTVLAFINFIAHYCNMTGTGTNIDKVSKLFDVLDKHIKEENCQYIPNELLKEYEKNNEYLY